MTASKTGIASALLQVQRNAPALHKDAKNPHYKNRYVTLDAVLDAVRPLLNSHGIIVSQLPSYDKDSGQAVLKTRLVHAPSGESLETDMLLFAPKQDPQGQGSAITYARRYSLLSILGLTADEDDDGNAGSKPSSPTAKQQMVAQAPEARNKVEEMADAAASLPGTRELAGPAVLEQIEAKRKEVGTSPSALKAHITGTHGRDSLEDLGLDEARMVFAWLAAKKPKAKAA